MLDKQSILELNELVEQVIGDKDDNRRIEKKISDEGIESLREAISTILKYKADFPTDLDEGLKLLIKTGAYGAVAYAKYPVKKSLKFPNIVSMLEKVGGNEEEIKFEYEKQQAALGDPSKKFPSISRHLEEDD